MDSCTGDTMTSKYTIQLITNKEYTPKYTCTGFSEELKYLSNLEGMSLPLLRILYKDCTAHQANYYECNGIWFFEPQLGTNEIVNFTNIHLIELELEYKGYHIFSYEEEWCRAVWNGEDHVHWI